MARIELNIVALGDFKSVNAQIKALQDQVTLLNKGVASVGISANLTKQLNEANAVFKSTILSTGQFTASTVRLKAETDKFGDALVGGKLKLTEYFRIIKAGSTNATAQMRALAMEQTKLQNSMVMSDPTKQGVLSVFTPTKINAISNATKIAANTQNLYNIAVDKGAQSLINWGKNTQWAGRQLTVGMTVPLTIFGSTAMNVFKEVNDQLIRMQKVYGNGIQQPTQQALSAIRGQILSLSKELASSMGVAVKDTAAMAADLAATGLQGVQLVGATREAIRLQKLGEMDQQDAMQTTISLQNVYKLSTNQLSGAIDFLNAVENQTSTSMQDLAAGIPKVGPIVQQLGGSFKDTALMMVAMKEAGVPAAQSANAIKSALASLINPTTAAKDAFAAYNINLSSIATKTGGNPIQMIMMLQESLKGLQPLAQAQLIDKLFGKYQQARIQALITNLGAVNSQTSQAFNLMNSSEAELKGIAAGELKTATESTTGKFRRAVETMKADLLPVGEKIMQVATALLNFGNSVAKVFGGLPAPVKTVLGIITAGIALSGPIIMFTGVLANFVGYLVKGLFSMKNLINGTKTFGQLFTPEIIASQNAAQLFSQKIMQDESAVMLLNQAVKQLTISLEGMAMGMAAASGTGLAGKVLAAEAGLAGGRIPFRAPKMATGGIVPGSPSAGDVYPALLQGGEAIIPTAQAQRYPSFINAMIDGTLPMHANGKKSRAGDVTAQATGSNLAVSKELGLTQGAPGYQSGENATYLPTTTVATPSASYNTKLASGTANPQEWLDFVGKEGGRGARSHSGLYEFLKLQSTLTPEEKAKILSDAHKEFESQMKALVADGKKVSDREFSKIADSSYSKAMKETIANNPEVAKSWETETSAVGSARTQGRRYLHKSGEYRTTGGTLASSVKSPESRMPSYAAIREANLAEFNDNAAESHVMLPGFVRKFVGRKSANITGAESIIGRAEVDRLEGPRGSSSSRPFANSPKFEPKIDLSGPSGSMARSSGSYTRTHNLILDKVKRQEEEKLAKQIDIASESKSASKATKRAAKNMVDGVTETLKESKTKVKVASQSMMEESLLSGSGGEYTNLASETEPGLATTSRNGTRFDKFNARRMAARAKLQSRMPKMMTGRFSNLGMGLGLQAAQQFGGQYIDKLPGGDVANSALTGASMGAFLGTEGALAGAALGTLAGVIKKTAEDTRIASNTLQSSFSVSSVAVQHFGLQANNLSQFDFSSTLSNVKSHASSIAENKAAVDKLTLAYMNASDQMTKDYITEVKNSNPQQLTKLIQQKYASDVAAGMGPKKDAKTGVVTDKAKEDVIAIMQAAGKNNIAQNEVLSKLPNYGVDEKTTARGFTSALTHAANDIPKGTWKRFLPGGTVDDTKEQQNKAVGVAITNVATTLPSNVKAAISGLSPTVVSEINKSKLAFTDWMGALKKDSPTLAKYLENAVKMKDANGKTAYSTLDLVKAISLLNSGLVKSPEELDKLLKKAGALDALFNSKETQSFTGIIPSVVPKLTKAEIAANNVTNLQNKYAPLLDAENKRIAALEKQKKLMDDQNSAAQEAIGYATQQTDMQNQIRKAMASGDYLQANLLRQQMLGNADSYNQKVISNQNTAIIDKARELSAAVQDKISSGFDPKKEYQALKNYNPKLGTYQVGSVNMPSAVQYGTSTSMGSGAGSSYTPTFNIVVNGSGLSTEQLTKAMNDFVKNQKIQLGMSGTKSKVGG